MAGFNVSSIQPQHLNELLLDKGHMGKLEAGFFGAQMIGADYTHYVDRLKGTVDKAPLSLLLPTNGSVRSSLVQTDSPTPKGNAALDVLNYTLNEYRFAMPLNEVVYKSADEAFRELERVLRLHAGLQVKVDSESDLVSILNGTRGATPVDLTGKEWDAYSDADHNPVKDILAAIAATAGTNMFIGRDVATALKQSPYLTGANAGGGTEFLTDAQLIEKLMGLGLANVWIAGYDFVNTRPLNLAPSVTRLHDGIAAIWAEGAIHRFVNEEFQYDMYEDKDTRKIYFRALETSAYESAYSESIIAFTNVLL